MRDPRPLLEPLLALHDAVRDELLVATERQRLDELALVRREEEGDTIYAIDVVSEHIVQRFAEQLARQHSFVLIAEGLPGGLRVFPQGADEATATWRIIVDPIDGTRGIMYDKRPAFILAALAPQRGARTELRDIVVAAMTELPTSKQDRAVVVVI